MNAANPRRTRGQNRDWRLAYSFALANASVFFAFALLNSVIGGLSIDKHAAAAGLFAIGSVFAFIMMIKAGGELAAMSFFVLGSGVFFGFGTAWATVADGWMFETLFHESIQQRFLPDINLMNSLSVVFVLLAAYPLCGTVGRCTDSDLRMRDLVYLLYRQRILLFSLAVIVIIAKIWTFPYPDDLLLRSFINKIHYLLSFVLLASGVCYDRLTLSEKLLCGILLAASVSLGVLYLSKAAVLLPLLAFVTGMYLIRRMRKYSVVMFLLCAVAYFTLLVPITNSGRNNSLFQSRTNTIAERWAIITSDIVLANNGAGRQEVMMSSLVNRFSHTPFQAFLMNEYEQGWAGNSMSEFLVALVPRVLWPDKPETTRHALVFYRKVTGNDRGETALAATYTAEAFWNLGWVGVVIVSIVIGLELGWLTRKWFAFSHRLSGKLGILIFSIPVIWMSFWLETWFVQTFVGGFVTLVILIKAADLFSPLLVYRGGRRTQAAVIDVNSSKRWKPSSSEKGGPGLNVRLK